MVETLWCDCSVNDVEEKYYADGEDAYDMRKPFKDVKSKPAILPKGSGQQKPKQGIAKALQPPEPSTPQTSNSELQTMVGRVLLQPAMLKARVHRANLKHPKPRNNDRP